MVGAHVQDSVLVAGDLVHKVEKEERSRKGEEGRGGVRGGEGGEGRGREGEGRKEEVRRRGRRGGRSTFLEGSRPHLCRRLRGICAVSLSGRGDPSGEHLGRTLRLQLGLGAGTLGRGRGQGGRAPGCSRYRHWVGHTLCSRPSQGALPLGPQCPRQPPRARPRCRHHARRPRPRRRGPQGPSHNMGWGHQDVQGPPPPPCRPSPQEASSSSALGAPSRPLPASRASCVETGLAPAWVNTFSGGRSHPSGFLFAAAAPRPKPQPPSSCPKEPLRQALPHPGLQGGPGVGGELRLPGTAGAGGAQRHPEWARAEHWGQRWADARREGLGVGRPRHPDLWR